MKSDALIFLFGGWIGVILMFVAMSSFYEYTKPYKQGQIDAVTGKMQFELKQQSDGTVKWERKEK